MRDKPQGAPEPESELVFDFDLEAPPEKVWRALTIPAFRSRWLPGGPDGAAAGPAGPVETEVLEADPPSHLRWRWREAGEAAGSVSFTLTPNADGGTLLRLVHIRQLQVTAMAPPANSNFSPVALAA